MNNEMKEPAEEQTPSASDERKSKGNSFAMVLTTPPPLKISHQVKMTSRAKKKETTRF